jgi:hypothetical protein
VHAAAKLSSAVTITAVLAQLLVLLVSMSEAVLCCAAWRCKAAVTAVNVRLGLKPQ